MRVILFFYITFYLYKNFVYVLNLIELNRLITTFKTTHKEIIAKHKTGDKIDINDFVVLIQKQPAVNKFISYSFYSLTYDKSATDLLENSFGIHRSLLRELDFRKYNWKSELNPLQQLLNLFQVPANLLVESGVSLNKVSSLLFNTFIYTIGYFLTMFSDEIKTFIVELFQ